MTTLRPSQSLLTRCLRSTTTKAPTAQTPVSSIPAATSICHHHQFHTSAPRPARRPRFKSVKAEKLGLTSPEKVDQYAAHMFPEYDAAQLEALKQVYEYTPEQLAAVEAGEAAISPRDLTLQGRLRDDKARMTYLEDFSSVEPIIDQKPEVQRDAYNPEWLGEQEFIDKLFGKMSESFTKGMDESSAAAFKRSMARTKGTRGTEIDFTESEISAMEADPELKKKFVVDEEGGEVPLGTAKNVKADTEAESLSEREVKRILGDIMADFKKTMDAKTKTPAAPAESTGTEIFDEADRLNISTSGEAPPLGKVPGVEGLYKHQSDPEDEGLDEEGAWQQLKKVTGLTVRDILSIYTKPLVQRYVVNQTRLGKVRSASVMVIAGNGNGRLGVGMAKSADVATANLAARMLAIRNMKPIRRYENRTIYGTVRHKISGTVVELRARPPGFGLRVPYRLFEMCRAAGIHDISAVIPRSKSPMNTVKATFQALLNQPDPEEIAKGRGKKMVDVRKVYYGGSVY